MASGSGLRFWGIGFFWRFRAKGLGPLALGESVVGRGLVGLRVNCGPRI